MRQPDRETYNHQIEPEKHPGFLLRECSVLGIPSTFREIVRVGLEWSIFLSTPFWVGNQVFDRSVNLLLSQGYSREAAGYSAFAASLVLTLASGWFLGLYVTPKLLDRIPSLKPPQEKT